MLTTPDQTSLRRSTLISGDRRREFEEISFQAIFSAIAERKRVILRNSVVAALVGITAAFLIPPTYTAEAVILTPQQSGSSLSSVAQISGADGGATLAALGWLTGMGLHNTTTLYLGILESRSIADAVIVRLDLRHTYKKKDLYSTRKLLIKNTSIKSGKDTLIHIRVEDRNPNTAASIAQAYVDELFQLNTTVTLREASQRRVFFEQQLAKEKDLLATAEIQLKDTEQSTGLVAPSGQADALVRSLSVLQAEILKEESRIDAMKTYIADDNPRLRTAERGLSALKADLARLEKGQHPPGTPEVAAGELPEAGLEYLRRYRQVKYHETLFEVLSKQYEAARLDEARAGGLIQVIDRPIPPERKSWPPRTVIVLSSTFLSAFVTSAWIVFRRLPAASYPC